MRKLTLITPTSDRPVAFQLCENWMKRARDRYDGEIQWIVADDGEQPVECTQGQTHLLRDSASNRKRSFLGNLVAALEAAEHDKILFIEDDDWYAADYLNQMDSWLDDAIIAGEANARYYYLPTRRFRRCGNSQHASLCQTGIRAELLPWMLSHLKKHQSTFIDVHLWKTGAKTHKFFLKPFSELSVGLKGLPGTEGIGMGHRLQNRGQHDASGLILKQWTTPVDAATYFNLADSTDPEKSKFGISQSSLKSALAILTYVPRSPTPEVRKRLSTTISSIESSGYDEPVFIVDDGSQDSRHHEYLDTLSQRYYVIRRKVNGGQSLAYNSCIRVLMESGIDVGFIAHDDIEFLRFWHEAYLDAHSQIETIHHYSWARDKHPRLQMRKSKCAIEGHEIVKTSRLDGPFLTFTPEVIARVGGFKKLPGKWGHTHTNWTRRIIAAGLAPFFVDITNSNDFLRIHEFGNHSSITQIDKEYWQRMNNSPSRDITQIFCPVEE